jgi:hypothetical protein
VGPPLVSTARPAFYALAPGGWRDYVTLLHPPYTLWHLSYVCIGAALAPEFRWDILGLALLAFFLGMGVAAHALDETQGRPLATGIGRGTLYVLATVSLISATAIGIVTAVYTTPWLLAFVAAGAFITVAYNLELFGGRFHSDLWFALGWGALPLLATYCAAAETIRVEAVVAALFAALLSHAQRKLSTPVRLMRRQVVAVSGRIELKDGETRPITRETLTEAPERALQALTGSVIALAVALVLLRVT